MKLLDKIILTVFSCVIFIVSALLCFVLFGWINIDIITIYIKYILSDTVSANITLGVSVVFIILAIRGIFFQQETNKESNNENGILIQNENGKLFISKDTIQNLVSGVVKQVEGAQDVSSKVVLSKDNFINIDVVLFVEQNVVIKDLSNSLQAKIKEAVKKSMDIDIKEVNIKIKNIMQTAVKEEKNS